MLESRSVAEIDDLVRLVDGDRLRSELEQAVKKLRKSRQFGLVFEEHIPEVLTMTERPLEVGGWAQRSGFSKPVQILSLYGDAAAVRVAGGGG